MLSSNHASISAPFQHKMQYKKNHSKLETEHQNLKNKQSHNRLTVYMHVGQGLGNGQTVATYRRDTLQGYLDARLKFSLELHTSLDVPVNEEELSLKFYLLVSMCMTLK